MIREFNSAKQIEKYYNKENNTYVFAEKGNYVDIIVFKFDLDAEASIYANDIKAMNINAWNIYVGNIKARDIKATTITACDIEANDIKATKITANNIFAHDIEVTTITANDIEASTITANDIEYCGFCRALNKIKCKSIKSKYQFGKHFVFNGELEVEEECTKD